MVKLVQDKVTIKTDIGDGEKQKDFILSTKSFDGEPERVNVAFGVTVSPRPYESIRVDYACTIHHEPGQKYREAAFELAQDNCFSRVLQDVKDLHSSGVITENFLIPKQ